MAVKSTRPKDMTRSETAGYQANTRSAALWRTVWRHLVRQPYQYLLLILGVAIGVAMMVSIDVANESASRAFQLSTEAVVGNTTHRVFGSSSGIDETVYTRLKIELGHDLAAPIVEGYVLSSDLGGIPQRIIGMDLISEAPFRNRFSDLAPESVLPLITLLLQPNSILITEAQAAKHDLKLDDVILIDSIAGSPPLRVVGILPENESSVQSSDELIFTDIATAQRLFGMIGKLSYIDLIAEEEEIAQIEEWLPQGLLLEPSGQRNNALQQMTSAFELNLTALSLLAMVVAMFLIYNVITFSVVQRRRLFGILRCLGATGNQLFGLILVEALVLGSIGAVLGIGIGLLLGRGMVKLVSQTINDIYFVLNVTSFNISALSLLKGLLVGMAAALFASIVPALEAKRIAPIAGLHRSALESKTSRATSWLLAVFLVLLMAGGLLLALDNAHLITAFAGLFIVLISFAFVVPSALKGAMPYLSRIFQRLLGVVGRMAPRDISRSLSRTAVAVAALMIAISVIIGVSIMIGSFRQTVDQWLGDTLQADIFLSTPTLTANRGVGALPAEVVAEAEQWPGVISAVSAWNTEIMAPEIGRLVEVIAVDGDISAGSRRYAWIESSPAQAWQALARGEGVFLSEPLVIREGLELPPKPIELQTNSGPVALPVLAIFYDFSSERGSIMMDQSLYRRLWQDQGVGSLGLFLQSGTDAEKITQELQNRFQGQENIVIQTNQTVRGSALDIFDRTFAITLALQLLAIVVAFIGVLSALMSIQLERRREFGILRAAGMSIAQLWRLILLETGLMGVAAGVLAVPVGTVLAWILIYIINRRSFGWTLDMNLEPKFYLQAFLVAVVAALLAGILPAIRSSRLVIASAVREE